MYSDTTDCFISYNNDDFIVKEEKLSDSDEQIPQPYPSDDTTPYVISPKKARSESFACVTIQKLVSTDFLASVNKKRPFTIIHDAKRTQEDDIKVKIEPGKKVRDNNRKEKRRKSVKKEDKNEITVKKEESEGNETRRSDESDKKMVQMIRNRISAQTSRDRRKAQLKELEDGKDGLSVANARLLDEKKGLLKELKKLEQSNNKLLEEKQRLLKKKKKSNSAKICVNCSKKETQTGFSATEFDDLWKNMETIGLLKQEDLSLGLSEEQKELGFSIGMALGKAMMECMKGQNSNEVVRKEESEKKTACSLFHPGDEEEEEESSFFGRKFSRSTLASPNLSSLTQNTFISEDYELNKPALTSFWETISTNRKVEEDEEKPMEKGEKKIWIDFQTKVMKENVMDGGSWKQRTSPLAKDGSVRLLNSQQ